MYGIRMLRTPLRRAGSAASWQSGGTYEAMVGLGIHLDTADGFNDHRWNRIEIKSPQSFSTCHFFRASVQCTVKYKSLWNYCKKFPTPFFSLET